MLIEFKRITDMIEWHIGPTLISGQVRTRDREICHQVVIRLEGYSVHERIKKRTDAQISIALEILRDIYNDRLLVTRKPSDKKSPDGEPKKDGGSSGRSTKKAPRRPQSKNKKRAGGVSGRSTD